MIYLSNMIMSCAPSMIARATAGLLAGLLGEVFTVLSLRYHEGRNGGTLRF
jgi:hypothetical protein